jgi:purine-cytosine permease-like protein
MPKALALVIIVVLQVGIAFFGHNLVQSFEKYAFPVLGIIFAVACITMLAKSHPSAAHGGGGIGGFLLTMGAAFGYAAGWNPYASDYTRYLPPTTSRKAVGLSSGLGVLLSCVLLEAAGAASATLVSGNQDNPATAFTGHLPTVLANLTLLAIALGAVSANVLNIYSGTMSFSTLAIKLPLALRRAVIALGFGVIGFIVALTGLHDAGSKYENFLLVIAYWIGPWLGVFFADQLLRRGEDTTGLLYDVRHRNIAGPVAMLVGMGLSIWLFSNQTEYTGPIPKHHPGVGDITFAVGFVIAAACYAVLFLLGRRRAANRVAA